MCVILPLKIINTGVALGRPLPIQRGCRQCFRSGHILPSIHPSLHPAVFQLLSASRKDTRAFQADINLIRSNRSETSHASKNLLSPILFINLSISSSNTVPVRVIQLYSKGSNTVTCSHADPQIYTYTGLFAQYREANTLTYTSQKPNQASGPCSLMLVKVINFLCEIRDHGGRTEGDGCQPQNHSLLSSTDTGAL